MKPDTCSLTSLQGRTYTVCSKGGYRAATVSLPPQFYFEY